MASSKDTQNASPNARLVFEYSEINLKHSKAISLAQKNSFLFYHLAAISPEWKALEGQKLFHKSSDDLSHLTKKFKKNLRGGRFA